MRMKMPARHPSKSHAVSANALWRQRSAFSSNLVKRLVHDVFG